MGDKMSEMTERNDEVKESGQQTKAPVNRRKLGVMVVGGVVCILAAALVIGYFAVAEYYKTHFLPGTTVNGIVSDGLDAAEMAALLEERWSNYELTVTGRDGVTLGVLTDEEAGLKVTGALECAKAALETQEYRKWPQAYLGRLRRGYDMVYGKEYDPEMVRAALAGWEALDQEKMVQPQNAQISDYIPEKRAYEILPEVQGNALETDMVVKRVLKALDAGETVLNVEDCYRQARITSENPRLVRILEEVNRMLASEITFDWNGNEVFLDADTIHEWIVKKPDGSFGLDEKAVTDYVAAQSRKYDTYGKHRYFTTALGQTIYVLNGGYGWKVDKEDETAALMELIREGAVVEREPVFWVKGMQKGTEDIGSSYVEIDLTHQHLYVFWKGEIVLETDFVSGDMAKGNVTPGGLFRLTYKTTDAVLRGRDYVTPVKYWMPFNGNIGMHDATWRTEFGGEIFLTNGSHGCINLPLDKAQAIFGYVSTGFPIICYYY